MTYLPLRPKLAELARWLRVLPHTREYNLVLTIDQNRGQAASRALGTRDVVFSHYTLLKERLLEVSDAIFALGACR